MNHRSLYALGLAFIFLALFGGVILLKHSSDSSKSQFSQHDKTQSSTKVAERFPIEGPTGGERGLNHRVAPKQKQKQKGRNSNVAYARQFEVIRKVDPETAGRVDFSKNAKPWIHGRKAVAINFGPLFAARDETNDLAFFDVGLESPIPVLFQKRIIRHADSFSMTGIVPGDPYSNIMLTVQDDVALANLRTSKGYYQVRYMGNGIHEVRQFDEFKTPLCGAPLIPETPGDTMGDSEAPDSAAPESADLTASDDGTQFDVLVVYTTDAVSKVGGTSAMIATVNLAIDETNGAYLASQIDPRLRLVHHESVVYGVKDSAASLSALRSTTDNVLDHVHTLRNTHGADLVAMLQDLEGSCGRAYLMTNLSSGFSSSAFSVTDYNCATGYYSFGHEIGHNLGCHHAAGDAGVPQGGGLFNYSHGWRWLGTNSVQYRSILAYSPGRRIQRFSNPNVFFEGTATGVPTSASNQAYNALSINNAALTASQWRTAASGPSEDNYEPNNSLSSAYNISSNENVPLSSLNGHGIQNDDDWYRIYVSSGYGRVLINCSFLHDEGDINVRLLDSSGNIVAAAVSETNNETIDHVVSSTGEFYFIQVYFADEGNSYDLVWDDLLPSSSNVPEIRVTSAGGSYSIPNGSTIFNSTLGTLFPNTPIGSTSTRSFRIYNDGNATLTLSGSEDSDHFNISNIDTSIAPGTFGDLEVVFAPQEAGAHPVQLTIASNDSDNSPYTFRIQGTGGSASGANDYFNVTFEEGIHVIGSPPAIGAPSGPTSNGHSNRPTVAEFQSSKVMQLVDYSSGLSYSQPSFSLNKGSSVYYLDFDVYLEDLDGGISDAFAVLLDTPTVRRLDFQGDGSLTYWSQNGGTILGPGGIPNDTWMHFTIVVDFATLTWEIYKDEIQIHSGIFTSTASPPDLSTIRFSLNDGDNDSDSVVYLDNIRIAADPVSLPPEDNYEPNNSLSEAFDFSGHEDAWLASIDGLGVHNDDDWFKIRTNSTDNHLSLLCNFTHAEGDIDLTLYSSSGIPLAASTSVDDNEEIDYDIPTPGVADYFVRLHYGYAGNTYDLKWSATERTAPDISVEYPLGTTLSSGNSSVDYGSVLIGANTSRTFVIRNLGDILLTGITPVLSGPDAADFQILTQGSSELPGGQSTNLSVRFSPSAGGLAQAILSISSNDPDENPFVIDLTATGVTPEITIRERNVGEITNGGSFDFGSVRVGDFVNKVLEIWNDGTGNLTVTSSTNGSSVFRGFSNLAAITSGRVRTVQLTFEPVEYGNNSETLVITSNDPDENPFTIQLRGFGGVSEAQNLSVTPQGIDTLVLVWTSVPGANNYKIYRSTDSDFSNASLVGTSSSNNYSDQDLPSRTRYYYWVESTDGIESVVSEDPVEGVTLSVQPNIKIGKSLGRLGKNLVLRTSGKRTVKASAQIVNLGSIRERMKFTGNRGTRSFRVNYYSLEGTVANITGSVIARSYWTGYQSEGEARNYQIKVRPKTKRKRAAYRSVLKAISESDPTVSDTARLVVKKVR